MSNMGFNYKFKYNKVVVSKVLMYLVIANLILDSFKHKLTILPIYYKILMKLTWSYKTYNAPSVKIANSLFWIYSL